VVGLIWRFHRTTLASLPQAFSSACAYLSAIRVCPRVLNVFTLKSVIHHFFFGMRRQVIVALNYTLLDLLRTLTVRLDSRFFLGRRQGWPAARCRAGAQRRRGNGRSGRAYGWSGLRSVARTRAKVRRASFTASESGKTFACVRNQHDTYETRPAHGPARRGQVEGTFPHQLNAPDLRK
jgi:hypothetical protein